MSTRSAYAIKNDDGTFTGCYIHWDGHPDGVGCVLRAHYNSADRIKELLAIGDLSILDKNIGEKQDFDSRASETCLSYSRDRNETNADARSFRTEQDFINYYNDMDSKFFYLFKNNNWFWKANRLTTDWQELKND